MSIHKNKRGQYAIVDAHGNVLSNEIYTSQELAAAQQKRIEGESFVVELKANILERFVVSQKTNFSEAIQTIFNEFDSCEKCGREIEGIRTLSPQWCNGCA